MSRNNDRLRRSPFTSTRVSRIVCRHVAGGGEIEAGFPAASITPRAGARGSRLGARCGRVTVPGSKACFEDVQTVPGRRAVDIQRREHEQRAIATTGRRNLKTAAGPGVHGPVWTWCSRLSLTLDVYSHVLPDMQQRAAERMEQLLFGN